MPANMGPTPITVKKCIKNFQVEMEHTNQPTDRSEVKTIRHVTWVGFWVNAILMVLKIAFGLYGHSVERT